MQLLVVCAPGYFSLLLVVYAPDYFRFLLVVYAPGYFSLLLVVYAPSYFNLLLVVYAPGYFSLLLVETTSNIYNMYTFSSFQLAVSENHSRVSQFTGSDFREFSSIAYMPVTDNNDYYTLADIIANGHTLNGANINVLAVVKYVSLFCIFVPMCVHVV